MLPLCLSLVLISANDDIFNVQAKVRAGGGEEIAGAQATLQKPVPLEGSRRNSGEWSERALGTSIQLLGSEVELVFDTTKPGELPDRVWIDSDSDMTMAPGELREVAWSPMGDQGYAARVALGDLGVSADLNLFSTADGFTASIRTRYHLESDFELDGQKTRAVWIDMNLDGVVTMGIDRWIALPADHAENLSLANGMFLGRETGEPWYFGNRTLRMVATDGRDGVSLVASEPVQPRHEFLARRAERLRTSFFSWFDGERASFFEKFEIDPGRKRATEPLAWYYTHDFADAVDLAAAEDKPLFVEFYTDACPWCKRLEWLNYRDAEIVHRLEQFTLVKIHVDLDLHRTAECLGLVGVPKSVLFDQDGEPLHVLSGWLPPVAYLAELDRAIE